MKIVFMIIITLGIFLLIGCGSQKQDIYKITPEQQKLNETSYKETNQIFLNKNKIKAGITITKSGLQYQILRKGSGDRPKTTSVVRVHYRGTFIDGKEFDSSYKRNESLEFPLNRVIRGWTEGLQLMQKGSKFKFFIPYNLGYGRKDSPTIPGYSTLIFEIELLDFR